MSRISYRCLPEERNKPISERTHWDVYYGQSKIGSISTDSADISIDRSHSVRIWKARLTGGFNAFEFPHVDGEDDIKDEPFVITNDDEKIDHNLELIHPSYMTMNEARKFIQGVFNNKIKG